MKLDPKAVVWELTLECDSKCLHCGSNALNRRKNELNTDESLNLVNQIADAGFKYLFLSGGEPTLRKDWYEISKEARKRKLNTGIISNALAWDNEMLEKICESDFFSVGFSVDGEEKVHDYLRGVDGSHKKVFDYIRELKKRGQTICAVTSVNKMNMPELKKIRNRLIVYGVDAWQMQIASPMGRMKSHRDIVLNENEYHELAEFAVETRERLADKNIVVADCIGYYGKLEGKLRNQEWAGCGAGLQCAGIRANGDVVGCLSMWKKGYSEGNIRDTSLKEIWENPNGFQYNRNFSVDNLKGQCSGCKYGGKCRGGCNSQAVAFFDEFNHSPYCLLKIEEKRK